MEQVSERCKGTTKTGEQCNLKPGPSGYCHLHDPERIAAEKAAQEEIEQRTKIEKDTETKRRSQQLQEITEVISVLEGHLQRNKENARRYQLLKSVVEGLYLEIDKLAKKAPAEQITELALEQINDVITDTKSLMQDDPYIQKLNRFVPAGDMPQLRDVLIVLGQVRQGLIRISGVWNTEGLSNRLEEANAVKLAIEYALEGENGISILQRIKSKRGMIAGKLSADWEVKEGYNKEDVFNLKLLDIINIQEYFIGK